jgi:hypothetical protein
VLGPDWVLQFRPNLFQGPFIEYKSLGEARLVEVSRAIEKVLVI